MLKAVNVEAVACGGRSRFGQRDKSASRRRWVKHFDPRDTGVFTEVSRGVPKEGARVHFRAPPDRIDKRGGFGGIVVTTEDYRLAGLTEGVIGPDVDVFVEALLIRLTSIVERRFADLHRTSDDVRGRLTL